MRPDPDFFNLTMHCYIVVNQIQFVPVCKSNITIVYLLSSFKISVCVCGGSIICNIGKGQ